MVSASCHTSLLPVTGQELWVKRLKWEGLRGFNELRWTPLDDPTSPGNTGAFCKTYKNFAFYWILKAGHMVRQKGDRITNAPAVALSIVFLCLS